jgi:hypothetical protein
VSSWDCGGSSNEGIICRKEVHSLVLMWAVGDFSYIIISGIKMAGA